MDMTVAMKTGSGNKQPPNLSRAVQRRCVPTQASCSSCFTLCPDFWKLHFHVCFHYGCRGEEDMKNCARLPKSLPRCDSCHFCWRFIGHRRLHGLAELQREQRNTILSCTPDVRSRRYFWTALKMTTVIITNDEDIKLIFQDQVEIFFPLFCVALWLSLHLCSDYTVW